MAQVDTNVQLQKLMIDSLREEHRELFTRALRNVLASDAAHVTYGQIVDGLPLTSVQSDHHGESAVYRDHPVHDHTELYPGALQRLQGIWDSHDTKKLKFDSTLVHACNSASPGSRAFQMRLIKIVAVAIHQISVELFEPETIFHSDDGKFS
ncbi:hypothetical protein F5Y19DRAFT_483098 [Xylariaceae sp. FL1651]|nr:hypothetical protein F5Y19DRAFT_483098 [Xylariaceae sp. FL1651]